MYEVTFFDMEKYVCIENVFSTLYIEIKQKCLKISFRQNKRYKKCPLFCFMSRREYLHRYVCTWDGLVCCSSDFLIYCSFCIKKVLYSEVHGINITITGSYSELNDTSLLPLAFASKKKGFVVSFRRKSLLNFTVIRRY